MKQNPKILPAILILCWIVVQVVLLYKNGIVTDGEAEKYISEARKFIADGTFTSANFWLYSTQIFLLIAVIKLNLGYITVVLLQCLINLAATFSLYTFTGKFFNRATAFTCSIIFLLNYPLQEFNTFLQTESLFYSFLIIYSCWLLQLTRITAANLIAIIFSLALISVTRPTGILFVPCTALYLFFRFFRAISTGLKILISTGVTVLFLYLLNLALGSGGELDFMLPYRDERIICGVPTLRHFKDIDVIDNGNSLYGLWYYVTHNWQQFFSLAGRRTVAFFGLLRSYYSTGHNIYLAVFFYPVYIGVLLSLRYWIKKNKYLFLYLITGILVNWSTVALTCDDWHNRFYLTIWSHLIVLALPVINNLFSKFASNDSNASV